MQASDLSPQTISQEFLRVWGALWKLSNMQQLLFQESADSEVWEQELNWTCTSFYGIWHSQNDVDTQSVIVEHDIQKPWVLICCYSRLHSSDKALHKILGPGCRVLLPRSLMLSNKANSPRRCWMGLRSELCTGLSNYTTPNQLFHQFLFVHTGSMSWFKSRRYPCPPHTLFPSV